MTTLMPTWLAQELADELEKLPAAEAAEARQLLAQGEHVVERWPVAGLMAWAVDVGPLEWLSIEPDELDSGGEG